MSTEKQVLIMYAAVNGYLDDVAVDRISGFESDFHRFVEANHPEIISILAKERDISDTTEESIKAAISEFKQGRVR
jgi:F-type H+-transporting ATPase subunit alpha